MTHAVAGQPSDRPAPWQIIELARSAITTTLVAGLLGAID